MRSSEGVELTRVMIDALYSHEALTANGTHWCVLTAEQAAKWALNGWTTRPLLKAVIYKKFVGYTDSAGNILPRMRPDGKQECGQK